MFFTIAYLSTCKALTVNLELNLKGNLFIFNVQAARHEKVQIWGFSSIADTSCKG